MKTILLTVADAVQFFGKKKVICDVLNYPKSTVSTWEIYVPDGPAWALLDISKRPEYKSCGKLKVKLLV